MWKPIEEGKKQFVADLSCYALTYKIDKNLNGLQSSLTYLSSGLGKCKLRLKVSCSDLSG